jgi:hypothetical protein
MLQEPVRKRMRNEKYQRDAIHNAPIVCPIEYMRAAELTEWINDVCSRQMTQIDPQDIDFHESTF